MHFPHIRFHHMTNINKIIDDIKKDPKYKSNPFIQYIDKVPYKDTFSLLRLYKQGKDQGNEIKTFVIKNIY